MTVYVDEAYVQKPDFEFKPKNDCLQDKTCISVTRDGDSIAFTGKLVSVPTNYTATQADGNKFAFIFGKEASIESTVAPTTKSSLSTDKPNQTQPLPPEQTTSSGESNGNDTGGGGDEHETVPTTSSGTMKTASVAVFLLAVFTPRIIQLLS